MEMGLLKLKIGSTLSVISKCKYHGNEPVGLYIDTCKVELLGQRWIYSKAHKMSNTERICTPLNKFA